MRALLDGPFEKPLSLYVNVAHGSVVVPPLFDRRHRLSQSGENNLRILWPTRNQLQAGHALPDYRLLNLRYGERFQPQDMDKVEPVPSGLIGRIRLTARPLE